MKAAAVAVLEAAVEGAAVVIVAVAAAMVVAVAAVEGAAAIAAGSLTKRNLEGGRVKASAFFIFGGCPWPVIYQRMRANQERAKLSSPRDRSGLASP